jgi:hypothetical protein
VSYDDVTMLRSLNDETKTVTRQRVTDRTQDTLQLTRPGTPLFLSGTDSIILYLNYILLL